VVGAVDGNGDEEEGRGGRRDGRGRERESAGDSGQHVARGRQRERHGRGGQHTSEEKGVSDARSGRVQVSGGGGVIVQVFEEARGDRRSCFRPVGPEVRCGRAIRRQLSLAICLDFSTIFPVRNGTCAMSKRDTCH
jgi:hypothetical protein